MSAYKRALYKVHTPLTARERARVKDKMYFNEFETLMLNSQRLVKGDA
jgi:hypothetical protein